MMTYGTQMDALLLSKADQRALRAVQRAWLDIRLNPEDHRYAERLQHDLRAYTRDYGNGTPRLCFMSMLKLLDRYRPVTSHKCR